MAAKIKAECSTDTNSNKSKDYKCSVCFKSGERREAKQYCPSCDVYYCKACVCDHSVLGRCDIQQWGSSKKRKTEDTCAWHPQEALEQFCESHDELCCRLCLSRKHRFCKDTQNLQSLKDMVATEKETGVVLQMLDTLKQQATVLNEDRNLRCQTVDKSNKSCQNRLGEFRKKANSKFDEIELELSKHKLIYLDRYKGDQTVCANALTALEVFQQRFGDTKQQYNAYELKKCKDWVSCTHDTLEMNRLVIKDSFEPISLPDIASTVDTINKLGTITATHTSFSTKIDGDDKACKIVGLCQMPDGSIIVADSANKKLKKFDPMFTAAGHCKLESSLRDVCCVNDTEVAVTTDDRKIRLVSIGDTLDITRSITASFDAYYIDSSNNKLYLPTLRAYYCQYQHVCLYIYDIGEEEMKEYESNVSVSYELGPRVAYSKASLRTYLIIGDGRLLSCDGENFIETKTKSDNIVGVCVDDADCVYVSDSSKKEVKKLDGETKETVVWSRSIPQTPGCLCLDRHHGRVLVACKEGDTVFVI